MKVSFNYTDELLILDKIFNKNNEDNLRIVGGAVRNFLINKKINDYDLSCKLLPEQTIALLEKNNIKSVPTGIKFGTVMAIINGKTFEITTTREDVKTDGRHAEVKFTNDFKIDAARRDFTFNALYLDFNGNIYDYFDGITDLNKGIVRFIGNAEKRIKEDYLRILRFFRFFSYYGSVLDNDGLKYSIEYKEKLKNLSGERIKSEMFKIFMSDYPLNALYIMNNNKILQIITEIEDFNFQYLEIFYSIKKYLNFNIDANLVVALILNNLDDLNKLRENWRFSKKENTEIFKLIEHKYDALYSNNNLKEFLFNGIDKQLLIKLLIVNSIVNSSNIKNNLLDYINNSINFIINEKIPTFSLAGSDLYNSGFKDKKIYSTLIKRAKELFIKSNFSLSKKEIIKQLKIDNNL